jgi:hypothetical protein
MVGRKLILYSNEVSQYKHLNTIQTEISNTADLAQLEILIVPLDSEELNEEVITKMKLFSLEDKNFTQTPNKCRMCIYKELCDYYKGD